MFRRSSPVSMLTPGGHRRDPRKASSDGDDHRQRLGTLSIPDLSLISLFSLLRLTFRLPRVSSVARFGGHCHRLFLGRQLLLLLDAEAR